MLCSCILSYKYFKIASEIHSRVNVSCIGFLLGCLFYFSQLLAEVRIHTDFHRFTEVGQIFQNKLIYKT